MNGMTFDTFRVDTGNRAAYDHCRRTATLQYEAGRPATLLGPEGAGKSHLLWAIVKHLSTAGTRVGLAFVMAREFPEPVRQLALNPAPLQDGKPALLLVDDLQSFEEDAYALEGVVKTFLAHGHGVLLASSVHPDRLLAFSEGFRNLLLLGDLFDIRPAAPVMANEAGATEALEELRAERDALEQKLAQKAAESAEIAQVRARLDEAMRQVEQLTLALADTSRFDYLHEQHQAELKAVIAERESYRLAVDGLREERDLLEKRLAERTTEAAEAEMLRERLLSLEAPAVDAQTMNDLRERLVQAETTHSEETAHLEAEILRLRSQVAQAEETAERANETQTAFRERIERLQAELSEYRGGLEEARALRRQLEEEQTAQQALRVDLARARELAEETGHALDLERTNAAGELEAMRRAIAALIAQARTHTGLGANAEELGQLRASLAEAQTIGAGFRLQLEQDRRRYEDELATLREEFAALQARATASTEGQERSVATLESLREQCRSLEYELEKSRKHNSLLTAEMEALRNEAATQVAQANIRAGEMESHVLRLREALDLVMQRGKSAAQHAEALSQAFAQATEALGAARQDLAALDLPAFGPAEGGLRGDAAMQPHLFDPAPFMRELAALPDVFETPATTEAAAESTAPAYPLPPAAPAPAERPLHELVEEALTQERPLSS